ncbi:TonB-dependent receptor [Pseudaquabacterium pictum]|uniref:TonB-dependent receptor n=1 Tax=Pseudaquabacterium pictum TaxID=2315236 RepID=A0A480AQL6_9BURK|nr:TonB-dependent receptor [Rubrivivax pictus]GCL62392.1 TonB-dependent receptor [Rubrivivax pictus]
MFKRSKVSMGVMLALSTVVGGAAYAQSQTVEITGSRIKRADIEGSQPVTTYTRADLEASGSVTVAEFIRNTTFTSSGSFRPQSGSTAQSFSGVSLRGLGSERTLVLVDGRRVAKAPNVGDSADMNSIPMAAVEKIEILTDGASAIYGSDAIGGVVNVILRKDFEGLVLNYGETKPSITGGDRTEASVIGGMASDKGRIVFGASKTSRDIIFVRDYPWGAAVGASSFSNGFYKGVADGKGGYAFSPSNGTSLGAAGTCDFPDKGFYIGAGSRCRYDFNLVAADEAALATKSVFARGEIKVGRDWSAYANVSSTNNTSFGRYAPVPDSIVIDKAGAGNLLGFAGPETLYLAHRFAAAGNRDTSTDATLVDLTVGAQGSVLGFDVDFGARRTTSKFVETGRGFIVKGLATAAINNGTYNIADPFANSDTVLKSITTTTGRDGLWAQTDFYANAQTSLFKLGGGDARLYVGLETSKQTYKDIYDSLSEAGEVLGSSGSSASGSRSVDALTAEMFMPITRNLEATVAARYEKYSDYGSDFSPKASMKWKVMPNLSLRASAGRGFRAPSLPSLYTKPSFSADTIVDPRHCAADGGFTVAECLSEEFQINGLRISNPNLKSEKSKQFSLGAIWDVTPAFSVKVDYWSTTITNTLSFVDAQEIVDRDNGDSPLPIPAALSITRDPATGAIVQIVSGLSNEGTLKAAGVDLSVLFRHSVGGWGKFEHELTWSERTKWTENGINQNGEFGEPKSRATLTNGWSMGALSANWNLNYIGRNEDVRGSAGGYVTHDVQLAWATPVKGLKLTVGAVNITGKLPQLVGSPYDQKPFNYYLYDAYGKQYYLKGEMKF